MANYTALINFCDVNTLLQANSTLNKLIKGAVAALFTEIWWSQLPNESRAPTFFKLFSAATALDSLTKIIDELLKTCSSYKIWFKLMVHQTVSTRV